MAEKRVRSIKRHVTVQAAPLVIEWASEKQREVFEYGPYPQCASGGFGSSKSWAFCLKALTLSLKFPNNRGVIARREFEMLKHTTMSTFFKICPPAFYEKGTRSDSQKYLKLNNGSEILWMHMDDPETENVIRGLEINWFFIDQAEETEEEVFDLLMTRLGRWDKAEVPEGEMLPYGGIGSWPWINPANQKPMVPTYPMIACNPDTEIHWIYRRFHPDSPEFQEKYSKLGYKLWNMRSDENKFLPKQNLDLMLSKDESFVRRFVRGEWGIPEGQIHEISPLSILTTDPADAGHPDRGVYVDGYAMLDLFKASCRLHRSFDFGDSAPTVCMWWAADQNGNIFAYREYYQPDRRISDHRDALYELSAGEKYQFQFADPSIFNPTMQRGGNRWSVADEYADRGKTQHERDTAIAWSRGDKDEFGTRNRISEYLKVDPERIHPVTKERGSPRLFFVRASRAYPNGCNKVLLETRSQRRLRLGTDLGRPIFSDERDDKIPDHSYDALRYMIASRPPVARVATLTAPKGSLDAVWAETEKWLKRGGPRMLARDQRRRYRALYGT